MLPLSYCLLVTGSAYGTQQASSAYQFAQALIASGHKLHSVFFYREGVQNGNQLTAPANDEVDLVRAWQSLAAQHQFELFICVAAALRRGVVDEQQANELNLAGANLADGFELSGLGSLAEAMMLCDRVVQF
ncbi:sulfurtransferase complex subunit TusD [Xenorhabdus innexi]|nr:sulfurtransferase complex subunit TusD [Xenorhabdus innexi]PHM35591.1 sulfurtransferase [Xenorhabdus innexi]